MTQKSPVRRFVSSERPLRNLRRSEKTLFDFISERNESESFETGAAPQSVLTPFEYQKTDSSTLSRIEIHNRRYLGNKYKLPPFIKEVVERYCPGVVSFADVFAGTGSVVEAFSEKTVITNDFLYCNYICHLAWFSSEEYDPLKITRYLERYNSLKIDEENYMSLNFADSYFDRQNCRKIGFVRENIESEYADGNINQRERALLISSLLYAMDRIANTCGHYDAFRQGASFNKSLVLPFPSAPVVNNKNNLIFNRDANELVREIQADLFYLDPPYNSRQYCDAYHLLENVARWEKPQVYGVARKMARDAFKSRYCTTAATDALEDLVSNIRAQYILLSYNNMASKGHDRSNARISDDDILRILNAKGDVQVFTKEYKAFSAGKSDISDNAERLFLCRLYSSSTPIM